MTDRMFDGIDGENDKEDQEEIKGDGGVKGEIELQEDRYVA